MSEAATTRRTGQQRWATPGSAHDRLVRWSKVLLPSAVGVLVAVLALAPLDDKDEASIRAMVDRIVDARVEDGQLDDADLTLKNIAQIKDAFVQQLLGMYHSRIKYPDNVVPLEQRREA